MVAILPQSAVTGSRNKRNTKVHISTLKDIYWNGASVQGPQALVCGPLFTTPETLMLWRQIRKANGIGWLQPYHKVLSPGPGTKET